MDNKEILSTFLVEHPEIDTGTNGIHLAIFIEPYLSLMINDKKTMESRFTKNKCAPYKQIFNGDIVIVKKSSGNIVGYFETFAVQYHDLRETRIDFIKKKYNDELQIHNRNFWYNKKSSRYVTLIKINNYVNIKPIKIEKTNRMAWIVLREAIQNKKMF